MTGRRTAFSLLEVLLALTIVALVLVPLLQSFITQSRVAAVSELHVVAGARARRLLDAAAALDYDTLKSLAASGTGTAADVPGLPTGATPLPPLVDAPAAELLDLSRDVDLPPHLERLATTVGRFAEALVFEELDPAGLARVVAVVGWEAPGAPGQMRTLRDACLVQRGQVALRSRPPLD